MSPPSAPAGSLVPRRPQDWDEITVGDLVLAFDAANEEGWWEAVVLAVEGDLLRLRWRDYPLDPIPPYRRDQVALLPPQG